VTPPGEGAGRDDILREVLKLQGLIRAVLRRYGVLDADLPDCTQDVLIVAYRHIQAGRFNPPNPSLPLAENVAAWLGGIAQWTAIEVSRTRARRSRVFSTQSKEWRVDVDALRVPSPEARIEAKDELAIFDRARLSPKQLEVVELAAQGYTAREIGELLGIPEDTAATRLKRARWAWERAKGKR
jgi:RNA polymerase sigma factor (sigma-70 family)